MYKDPRTKEEIFSPWSHVVIALVDGKVKLLEGGAEYHGDYANPGPHQHQAQWVTRLADEHGLPDDSEIHIFGPTNDPESDHCAHLAYRVLPRQRVTVVRIN